MSGSVIYKTAYDQKEITVSEQQVLRYLGMGGREADPESLSLLQDAMARFSAAVRYQVCWRTLPVGVTEEGVDLGCFAAPGKSLANHLRGCRKAILFAATTGMELEQLRRREAVRFLPGAVVLDAVATAAVEALCDRFCADRAAELEGELLRPRFSPGYGDLPLQLQQPLLQCLDSHRKIGLALSETMLMLPQKSVTAIVGIGTEGCTAAKGCENCEKRDCPFRLQE